MAIPCSFQQSQCYKSKISCPLVNLLDIHFKIPIVPYKDMMGQACACSSAEPGLRLRAKTD